MASVICLSNSEPICIAGHDHKWGGIYKIKITVHEIPRDEKCKKCSHCSWIHLYNYSGVGKYRKLILLDNDMERSKTEPLCLKCKKTPSTRLTSNCQKCEDMLVKKDSWSDMTERGNFISAEIAGHGDDIWSLEKKYDIQIHDLLRWMACDERKKVVVMLKKSTMITNEYDNAEFIKHISNLKNGFKRLDAAMSAYNTKLRIMEKAA